MIILVSLYALISVVALGLFVFITVADCLQQSRD